MPNDGLKPLPQQTADALARALETLPGNPDRLILRSAQKRSGGDWSDDDYDVVWKGLTVGRIYCLPFAPPSGRPWFWGIEFFSRAPGSLRTMAMLKPARRQWRRFVLLGTLRAARRLSPSARKSPGANRGAGHALARDAPLLRQLS